MVTIIKIKDRILAQVKGFATTRVPVIAKQRSSIFAEAERLLMDRGSEANLVLISAYCPFRKNHGVFRKLKEQSGKDAARANVIISGSVDDEAAAKGFPRRLAKINPEELIFCASKFQRGLNRIVLEAAASSDFPAVIVSTSFYCYFSGF